MAHRTPALHGVLVSCFPALRNWPSMAQVHFLPAWASRPPAAIQPSQLCPRASARPEPLRTGTACCASPLSSNWYLRSGCDRGSRNSCAACVQTEEHHQLSGSPHHISSGHCPPLKSGHCYSREPKVVLTLSDPWLKRGDTGAFGLGRAQPQRRGTSP